MIIRKAFTLLRNQLEDYLKSHIDPGAINISVAVDDVNKTNVSGSQLEDTIIISLIRIEEERTLNNNSTIRMGGNSGQAVYENPEMFLNLYVLYSAYFSSYDNALMSLSYALEFFQSKNTFTALNSPDNAVFDDMDTEGRADFCLNLELHSLSYEQTNYLWGTFGGKQLPHFVHKARLIGIRSNQIINKGSIITETQSKEITV